MLCAGRWLGWQARPGAVAGWQWRHAQGSARRRPSSAAKSGRGPAGGVPASGPERTTDMDLRLTRPSKPAGGGGSSGGGSRGAACLHAGASGGCSGRVSIAGRGARRAGRGRGGASVPRRPPVRLGAASARSSPVHALRRAGVSPQAPGGGGEPRAARPRADAAAARSRSAPSPPPPHSQRRRRARSLAAPPSPHAAPAPPAPRLRPVFLWARQRDGTVQEVHCEDYDERNRIRIARTPSGWRVIPRTETYDSILVPKPPSTSRERNERRRRRRRRGSRRRRPQLALAGSAWGVPDLESHIPSHTIAVPRALQPSPEPLLLDPTPSLDLERSPSTKLSPPSTPTRSAPPTPIPSSPAPRSPLEPPISQPPPPQLSPPPVPALTEPTPLDNLLAVAELEFNQQQGEAALELQLQADAVADAQYPFLPEEEVTREVMSFDLGDTQKAADEMFFERKTHDSVGGVEDPFPGDMVSHKELFDSISEAHYLPELGGPHDDALLESLVEKGCEDNQILGQALDKLALDKLAHLVQASGEYAGDDLLLGDAPVADIIDRLESLSSPARSSMTAAQGLLHLHHIGDHIPARDHSQGHVDGYMSEEVFGSDIAAETHLETLSTASELRKSTEVNRLEYEQSAEKRLQSNGDAADIMYTEQVPEINETFENKNFEDDNTSPRNKSPERVDTTVSLQLHNDDNDEKLELKEEKCEDLNDNQNSMEANLEDQSMDDVEEVATDLRIKHVEKDNNAIIARAAETTNAAEDSVSDKSDEQPKDLSIHRRLPTPHASPRRIETPRAPSRESDAMQSPQPSGIPAISSPEVFNVPATKNKTQSILDAMFTSSSPKMYLTSEVSITKQQSEPINLGKHRKSASPTVSSCSDEIRKLNKELGEPAEKKQKRETLDELLKMFNVQSSDDKMDKQKKQEKAVKKIAEELEPLTPLEQWQILKSKKFFNLPHLLMIPKTKFQAILDSPCKELLDLKSSLNDITSSQLHVTDTLMISLDQLEKVIIARDDESKNHKKTPESKEPRSRSSSSTEAISTTATSTANQTDQNSPPKPIPSMAALGEEFDAASARALQQAFWIPYMQQMEAMSACTQNADFLKALNASGYTGANYSDLTQMLNHPSRLMNPAGFPVMPMDYDSRVQLAIWQEMMLHNNAAMAQRQKSNVTEAQMKEAASKANEFQSPYVHSTNKNHLNRALSSARTSPIANNYANSQRAIAQNPFLQGMYPGMGGGVRPGVPMPGINVPYFNPNMMAAGSQRSPRSAPQKSPTTPYYPNNNYLHSLKQSEAQTHHRNSSSSQESARPRISVKSLQELQAAAAASSASAPGAHRRAPVPAGAAVPPTRRRDEPEVGSTTPLGEQPHVPTDGSPLLWHPLFGNQKNYASPWPWTTVTATGD